MGKGIFLEFIILSTPFIIQYYFNKKKAISQKEPKILINWIGNYIQPFQKQIEDLIKEKNQLQLLQAAEQKQNKIIKNYKNQQTQYEQPQKPIQQIDLRQNLIQQIQQEKLSLMQKLQQINEKYDFQIRRITSLQRTIEQDKQKYSNLQRTFNGEKEQKQTILLKIEEKQRQYLRDKALNQQKHQNQLKNMQFQLEKKDGEIQILQNMAQQKQALTRQHLRLSEIYQKLQKDSELLKKDMQNLQKDIQQKTNQINQTIQKSKMTEQFSKKCKSQLQQTKLSQARLLANEYDLSNKLLFQNDVLEDHLEMKKFLRRTIEEHMRCKIVNSRLIYRFDPISKVNFHKYIDQKENIVLIIKLTNGNFIAGYSEGCFEQGRVSEREGIIMNLTKREVFHLAQSNRRAISYDDYYIIFGNSQIRLRSQEQVVFSNFGIANSYFNSRGKKVCDFLGGKADEREVGIQGYEIYQIQMEMD